VFEAHRRNGGRARNPGSVATLVNESLHPAGEAEVLPSLGCPRPPRHVREREAGLAEAELNLERLKEVVADSVERSYNKSVPGFTHALIRTLIWS
jgi:hypothetical protein